MSSLRRWFITMLPMVKGNKNKFVEKLLKTLLEF